ncbi:PQQ-binding-like beta-propeller repeat protein [Streptomyces sp. NPDC006995]|uniref:outer membrane protein assembly factor BamB family protein n=1 Tax=Streptomyces sp. NPDC006995 TaxID=3156907 RepID=UPI0033FDF402
MSQPPPQQQGFGAPYEPRPGVYGDPGQPGPGPQLGPRPGPYGPPPQPPYGSPQFPAEPAPVVLGGPGGGGRSRSRLAGLVAGGLAGLLVVGTGVWLVVGGDGGSDDGKPVARESTAPTPPDTEDGPEDGKGPGIPGAAELSKGRKDGEAPVRWVENNRIDLPEGGVNAYGPWITGGIAVQALYRTVSGHALDDGARRWSLRLPADICAAPTTPSTDGKIVVGVRSDTSEEAQCDRILMIDLTTGKTGWKAELDRKGFQDGLSDIVMAVNGDVVTVGRLTRTDAYRISDGKHLWDRLPGPCQPFGLAGGAVPLAALECRKDPGDGEAAQQEVRRIDPATGRTVWTYQVKKGWEVDQFYSTNPPVVSLRQGGAEGKWAIAMLNDDGTFRSQPDPGTDDYQTRCGGDMRNESGNLDNCYGVAADAGTLYLATKPASEARPANAVVAFDMSTGKRKWKAASPATQTLMPLRVEGGKVLLHLGPSPLGTDKVSGGIMALGPGGGTPQPVLRHPTPAVDAERTFQDPQVHYANGRSLLLSPYVSGVDDRAELELRTMIAFGD